MAFAAENENKMLEKVLADVKTRIPDKTNCLSSNDVLSSLIKLITSPKTAPTSLVISTTKNSSTTRFPSDEKSAFPQHTLEMIVCIPFAAFIISNNVKQSPVSECTNRTVTK